MLSAFVITLVSVITIFRIDIVIEQDEQDKFVGSLLIITQRSYGLLVCARVGVRQLAASRHEHYPCVNSSTA
jgi:hypothetical protein